MPIRLHDVAADDLREAIRFTSEETGFGPRLIEKDYFCSVILQMLAEADTPLVFKGGTCLAKIHAGFFRLSEDLDFSISVDARATRGERTRAMGTVKKVLADLPARLPGIVVIGALTGHNASRQYVTTLGYHSLLGPRTEAIAIEIGLREPILTPCPAGNVRTALVHWVRRDPLVETFPMRCLSYSETMAEKLRAALCRQDVAIRDFFDVDHAVRYRGLDASDAGLLDLLRRKLEVPGTGPVDVSPARLATLRRQLDTQLQPVLREQEFDAFDLDRAIDTVSAVAAALRSGS